ncbi:VanZ family protein [Streptomyces lateritius]|uniref:VanZ family protein n=1 Tax=Streptomyces lateritius TaxID=67313 RepID=UPI001675D94D|nr:VanZ family protein [Streptomyces lateritius]GGU12478.1 hypothetical protein GCM10010272_67020 [Streptomyces lateritius]
MIEASVSALPGLIIAFLIISVLFAGPTILTAKIREKPVAVRASLAIYLAGIVAVTLMPGNAGLSPGQCDIGTPLHLLTSASSLLNIALFLPGSALAVLVFRQPFTVAAAFVFLSGAVELVQSAAAHLGRSCSVTDLAANMAGAAAGAVMGSLYLRWRQRPILRPGRDLFRGATVALMGGAIIAGIFQSRVEPVDVVAKDDRTRALAESSAEADEWITEAANAVFGDGTQMQQIAAQSHGKRLKITAETNRGSITGWWPQKELEHAWSSNTLGDEGDLNKAQVAAAADTFAREWFLKRISGSQQRVRPIGDGETLAYVVAYRRYVGGVMMPMRLDITITTTGRIIGFVAKNTADPVLPPVRVDEADARKLSEEATGLKSESTLLLAQQIGGRWRPVWLVGSGKNDVTIDAVTGQHIPTAP